MSEMTPEQRAADKTECDSLVARLRAEEDEYKRSRFPPGADVLTLIAEYAAREIESWRSYACQGSRDTIGACSDEYERQCDRAASGCCPKRSVLADGWTRCQRAIAAGFDENALYEWSGFDVYGRIRSDAKTPHYADAFKALVEAFANGRYLVVLSGETGTGKTMASSLLAIWKGARMVTAQRIIETNRFSGELDAIGAVPALVVDDLGTEYMDQKGEAEARWDGLFNRRYRMARMSKSPFVVTCNLTAKDFKSRYGARVADRIVEVGKFIEVGGTSMRRK
jgi:DNA replication protein DnaC